MKINLLTIGKIKEQFYRDAIAEYLKRLSRFCKVNIIELGESRLAGSSPKDILSVVQEESLAIMQKLSGYNIALDLRGTMISSQGIADTIRSKAVEGISELTFIIGGSYGLSAELLSRVGTSFCFGNITFPHQLMRVVLLEQVYRAFMINSGSEYHK